MQESPTTPDYQFTNDWFNYSARPVWSELIPILKPGKALEIGSYEGASTCFLIDTLASLSPLEIHCIDTWDGGIEHAGIDMSSVEQKFTSNTKLATERAKYKVDVIVHKGSSDLKLAELLASGGQSSFDFIYVDGSHQAPDVIYDAILSFRLLRIGGILAFDDYLWAEGLAGGIDLLRCPKPAIDAFVNLYFKKLKVLQAPLQQLYIQKVTE